MSLTSILRKSTVHKFFMDHLTIPKLPSDFPDIKLPTRTNDPAKMGTALDYGIRFWLQHKYKAAHTNFLIAEIAHIVAKEKFGADQSNEIKTIAENSKLQLTEAKSIDSGFAFNCFQLANLDIITRKGIKPKQIPMVPTEDEIKEFMQLMNLAVKTWPKVDKYCLLNPSFNAGNLVGGADADIIQDDVLIDIKCVKIPDLPNVIAQLIGYVALSNISGVDGIAYDITYSNIAIYFARHGYMMNIKISDVVTPVNLGKIEDYLLTFEVNDIEINDNWGPGGDMFGGDD